MTPKNFSKNLKLRVRYFLLGRPSTDYVQKKIKIVRVTARSIWAGMRHIYIFGKKFVLQKKMQWYSNSGRRESER